VPFSELPAPNDPGSVRQYSERHAEHHIESEGIGRFADLWAVEAKDIIGLNKPRLKKTVLQVEALDN